MSGDPTDEQRKIVGEPTLEERRLALETTRVQRELDLRTREVETKEKEVATRQKEVEKPAWRVPIFVAVLAGALGLVGNLAVTGIQGYYGQRQIADKAGVDERLAREKADSDLILEASKGEYVF